VILGYEWLESFGPMKIHWTAQWMAIPYGDQIVVLQGILSELVPSDVVEVFQLSGIDSQLQKDVVVMFP
jgi:hypothetical protein